MQTRTYLKIRAYATAPIGTQFETAIAAVYFTYTRRAPAMKCVQMGLSPRGRRQNGLASPYSDDFAHSQCSATLR